MKISWAAFRFGYDWGNSDPIQPESILKLEASGFHTEREAKKYIQHPDNCLQGSFVVLEVIEMPRKTK